MAAGATAQRGRGGRKAVKVMFMDEGRFGRIEAPRRCWAPAGMRPSVPAQFVREYLYGYLAVCPFDGDLTGLILPEVHAEAMSVFLREVAREHPLEHVVLIMDQAGWHKAKALDIPSGISLFWLPPYSPELNPVEHLWDDIREKWFHNRAFACLDAVQEQLVHAFRHLMRQPELVKSLTLFEWMVN